MLSSYKWGVFRWTLLSALGAHMTACGGATSASGDGDGSGGASASGGDTGESGGSTSGGTTGAGGSVGALPTCTNPQPVDGGFIRCDEGYVHRPKAEACSDTTPRSELIGNPDVCDPTMGGCCLYDSDCPDDKSYCMRTTGGPEPDFTYCATGCLTDADCTAGNVCQCNGGAMGSCVPGNCTTDADCSGDARCSTWSVDNGCGAQTTFSCQTQSDQCGGPSDCAEGQECALVDGRRVCRAQEFTCVAGRPFLVEEQIRMAGLKARDDWCDGGLDFSAICVDGLSAQEKTALANYYGHSAQLEHASIAAFARFTMQLLSLGAPLSLVAASNQAIMDETRHASMCFSVASLFGGSGVGPSTLKMDGALSGGGLSDVVRLVIEEGCIGETVAALLELESAAQCELSVLQQMHDQIAADELRHAELAWRFVAWALAQQPDLQGLIKSTFEQALRAASVTLEPEVSRSVHGLGRYGVLSDDTVTAIRRYALFEVVRPCAAQLLSDSNVVEPGATIRVDRELQV